MSSWSVTRETMWDNVADVCGDVLRAWRQMEGEIALVDLKSAYLQVRVAKELWQYQLVRYQGGDVLSN